MAVVNQHIILTAAKCRSFKKLRMSKLTLHIKLAMTIIGAIRVTMLRVGRGKYVGEVLVPSQQTNRTMYVADRKAAGQLQKRRRETEALSDRTWLRNLRSRPPKKIEKRTKREAKSSWGGGRKLHQHPWNAIFTVEEVLARLVGGTSDAKGEKAGIP